MGPHHYPEITQRVLIVNAPKLFAGTWTAISPLLPERTRKKVRVARKQVTIYLTECNSRLPPVTARDRP